MITIRNGVKHYVTLHNVLYNPDITQNLVSIAQVRKKGIIVRISDHPSNKTRVWMDFFHEPSNEVNLCALETLEGLFEALTIVHLNQA